VISREPWRVPREPTVAQLLTGLMQDAQTLLRQEVALATHELRRELRTTRRAVMSLGIGIGLAAIGGWLLILMLVHLLHALRGMFGIRVKTGHRQVRPAK
jgi:hypothetical protein